MKELFKALMTVRRIGNVRRMDRKTTAFFRDNMRKVGSVELSTAMSAAELVMYRRNVNPGYGIDSFKVPGPIYVIVTESDCDWMEVTYAMKFSGFVKFAYWYEHDLLANREGPQNVYRCTEQEYNEFKSSRRDLAAEAMGY